MPTQTRLGTMTCVMVMVAIVVAPAGCQPQPTGPQDEPVEPTEPVKILRSKSGSDAALGDHGLWLINSDDQLEALDAESLLDLDVDFQTESLVLLALGQQPTGGYWVRITGVSRGGPVLYVHGTANRPGPDQVTVQVLTYPFAAAAITKTQAATLRPEIDSSVGQSVR